MKLKLLLGTNLSRKIVIIFSLALLILCSSSLAFASEVSSSQEQEPPEVDQNSLSLQTKAQEYRAVERTITDVYNLLDAALFGDSTYAMGMLAQISDQLEFWVSGNSYTIADLQGMTWQIANTISNQLSTTNGLLSSTNSLIGTTNAKLEYVFSAIEDTINIKWYDPGFTFVGTSTSLSTGYISSNTVSKNFYVRYSGLNTLNAPSIFRLFLPIRYNSLSLNRVDFNLDFYGISSGSYTLISSDSDYFFEPTSGGTYCYIFNFRPVFSEYFFKISSSNDILYISSIASYIKNIPFDTLDYQIIYSAFSQAKTADSLSELSTISSNLSSLLTSVSSGSQAAEALADYIVSPEKQAAEDASQAVINGTLDNFTGNGAGAAKYSDQNSLKDASSYLQSGLDSGASSYSAFTVFGSSSDFWGWFTQQNSNYINNPYPAPVVSPTRGTGDEIVDFLTPNSNELQDLLRQGGDQR